MAIEAKNKLPLLKCHNLRGCHGLIEHILTLGEVFVILEAVGDSESE